MKPEIGLQQRLPLAVLKHQKFLEHLRILLQLQQRLPLAVLKHTNDFASLEFFHARLQQYLPLAVLKPWNEKVRFMDALLGG